MGPESSLKNHGRAIPSYYSTRDPEAVRGTAAVRVIDRELFVALDTRRQIYVLFGPSLSMGGWMPLMEIVNDFGVHLRPPIAWEQIAGAIQRSRDHADEDFRQMHEHNERLRAYQERVLHDLGRSCTGYVKKAVAGQREGWGRWSPRDVMIGLHSALKGRSKEPDPNRTVFSPGVQPDTGGVPPEPSMVVEE